MEKNRKKLLDAIYSNDFTQIKRAVKRANKRDSRYLKDRVY
jgi:hypothetical protein